MCVAISQTPDPTAGTWFLYTFNTLNFPDYPKFGVWPNGYFMSSHERNPGGATCPGVLGMYVFDRTNMLLGFAAMRTTMSSLGSPAVRDTRILPADLDGTLSSGGRPPNFFVRTVDSQQDPANPTDRIEVYETLPDWVQLTFSFSSVDILTPAPFQTMLCNRNGGAFRDCIPQPTAATNTVDALSNRPMMQLKYRNFGSYEAMVFNQTIDTSGIIPFVLGFTPIEEVRAFGGMSFKNPEAIGRSTNKARLHLSRWVVRQRANCCIAGWAALQWTRMEILRLAIALRTVIRINQSSPEFVRRDAGSTTLSTCFLKASR